jgi:hypothetical protein
VFHKEFLQWQNARRRRLPLSRRLPRRRSASVGPRIFPRNTAVLMLIKAGPGPWAPGPASFFDRDKWLVYEGVS